MKNQDIIHAKEIMMHLIIQKYRCYESGNISTQDAHEIASLLEKQLSRTIDRTWIKAHGEDFFPSARDVTNWIFFETGKDGDCRYSNAKLQVWLEREVDTEIFDKGLQEVIREISQQELLWEWIERFWPDVDKIKGGEGLIQYFINCEKKANPKGWRSHFESAVAEELDCPKYSITVQDAFDVLSYCSGD